MGRIQLLDCTLRDGAYIVDAKFGSSAIKGIVNKLQNAGIDIIECGWLKNSLHEDGTSFYHIPEDFKQYLSRKDKNIVYTAMIDWDRYDLSNLPDYDGKSIDAIRVVFPHGKYKEGVDVGRQIAQKGYKVFFQAANTLAYNNTELIELAKEVNSINAISLSIVDTFGAMYEEDLDRILNVLDAELKPEIRLGFHSHNNQQLSFALTMHFAHQMEKRIRAIVIDSSLCGMGRGAGNATTELVASFLNRKCGCHYNLDEIMDAIDVYMCYFQEKYRWGYSTPYFIAGLYCCHVNNIAYLLKNHRTSAKDMRNIIESLSQEDRKKYDYDLLEKKYLKNQDNSVDDSAAVAELQEELKDRPILIVAPGKMATEQQKMIQTYIVQNNPIVIGVNAILPNYKYDYVFFVNAARYAYSHETNAEAFKKFKKIVLSNIKTSPDKGEKIVYFNSAIKRGWEHYDNAVICCLRFLERINIQKVAIAGFDGFKDKYNESYADPFLPTLNPGNQWEKLNQEIKEIFVDFKKNAIQCKDITFLTPSYFEN